ncbi:uncharacterized protein LOC135161383 [Diachasmimorpha longicaudata]|uniref:uncharacterized protein LOC135161383 n=1 Tax=Diachasmimorpha longicaudata TaxID=58733 RepID=UPI0030B8DAE0
MGFKVFLIIFIYGIEARTFQGDKCTILVNYRDGDLQEPQPLILSHSNKSYNFLYPQKTTGELTLNFAEKFILSCPGKRNFIRGIASLKRTTEIEAVCLRGTTFVTRGARFDFTSVSCNILPFHKARSSEYRCYGDSSHIEIGFQLERGFLPTFKVCRDNETFTTYYTKYLLSKSIGAYHSGFPRPFNWISGNFYGKYDINSLYKRNSQLETLTRLLDSERLANKYISGSAFMSRGHLTAKVDFVYGSAQRSTFWYLNAAPQWQQFNGGNWETLESSVRRFADRNSLDLIVYTGTHGQMSLMDENNNPVPIYLYADGDEYALPVPRFFWKIIYDPERMLGTAFVGVNDPYAAEITDDMFICKDIADRVKWLTWQGNNIYKGVSYACSIDDLRLKIPSVPKIKVNGLLY